MAEYVAASEETEVIEILRDYLTKKAEIHLNDTGTNGIIRREWNRLNRKFMKKEFDGGRRDFWGVVINDEGYPIEDKNDPDYHLTWKIVMVYSAKQQLEISEDKDKHKDKIEELDKLHKELLKEKEKYKEGN